MGRSNTKEEVRGITVSVFRFGVIGWGLRKSIAMEAVKPHRKNSLAVLCDPDPAVDDNFRSVAGPDAAIVRTLDELIALRPDAVFVLSPDDLHEPHAIQLLEAGIPIYLEKPMAITTEGCDRILAAQERTGTRLYLGHNMRHMPVIRKMKEWIEAGRIGRVTAAWCRHFVSYGGEAYFMDWHADRRRSTGLLLQKGAHDIDVLHWLCGSYSVRAVGMGRLSVFGAAERLPEGQSQRAAFRGTWPPESLAPLNPVVDVEDLNHILLELENGVLATYQQCQYTPDGWRNYTIIGTEGRIENFGDVPGNAKVCLWNQGQSGYRADADDTFTFEALEGGHGGADALIMDEFLRYLADGGETDTTPWAARMSVAAGYAATESLRNGSVPVRVG